MLFGFLFPYLFISPFVESVSNTKTKITEPLWFIFSLQAHCPLSICVPWFCSFCREIRMISRMFDLLMMTTTTTTVVEAAVATVKMLNNMNGVWVRVSVVRSISSSYYFWNALLFVRWQMRNRIINSKRNREDVAKKVMQANNRAKCTRWTCFA